MKLLRRILQVVAAVVLLALVALSYLLGGPRNIYGMIRYALPRLSRGALRAGDAAPDALVTALDGKTTFHLRERIGGKPLVLVFGSYT